MTIAAMPKVAKGLRHYQQSAFDRIVGEFTGGVDSTLLVLPTGTGKTYTFGNVARWVIDELGGRVLVLAHRGELLTQAANELATIGIEAAVEKAESRARGGLWGEPDCVVASVQSMQGKRLASWPEDHFKLIVTDEAHHAPADSYRRIYRHFESAWHLGVTATADRFDGENLGTVYRSLAYEYSLREAIEEGYLSRLKVVRCETSVDLRDIRTTGGDLNQGDLEDAIAPHIEELANATRQEIGARRSIVFTPDVGSAEAFATALSSVGIPAESVSGDSADRDQILERFRRGKIQCICNCNLLTEGYNAPFVSAIVMARPTKSRALFAQMAGRGTRVYLGKPDCLLVDFAWLTGKHKLVSPVELFDTNGASAEVQEVARGMVESGRESDLMEAIERAERVTKERQRMRVVAREREARYRKVSYDPMAVFDVLGTALRDESSSAERATAKQVEELKRRGVEGAESMSKRRATMLIGKLFERRDAGLATHKQVAWCITKGMDPAEARGISFEAASAFLDEQFKRGRAS